MKNRKKQFSSTRVKHVKYNELISFMCISVRCFMKKRPSNTEKWQLCWPQRWEIVISVFCCINQPNFPLEFYPSDSIFLCLFWNSDRLVPLPTHHLYVYMYHNSVHVCIFWIKIINIENDLFNLNICWSFRLLLFNQIWLPSNFLSLRWEFWEQFTINFSGR